MLTDRLWGTTLRELKIDVCTQTLLFILGDSRSDSARISELRLADVREFRFFNSIEGPWDYAEFTEIHIQKDEGSGQWTFDILLWFEDAGISGTCLLITLDGVELTATS